MIAGWTWRVGTRRWLPGTLTRTTNMGEVVSAFALYMAYLQKVEGLIDSRNLIAY
jgi:hypothetical protein